jgi:hypothetical protein
VSEVITSVDAAALQVAADPTFALSMAHSLARAFGGPRMLARLRWMIISNPAPSSERIAA